MFDAFERAKRLYVERLRRCSSPTAPTVHARVLELTGGDPLPYGVEPNRAMIEELIDHAVAQRILRRRPSVERLFSEVVG